MLLILYIVLYSKLRHVIYEDKSNSILLMNLIVKLVCDPSGGLLSLFFFSIRGWRSPEDHRALHLCGLSGDCHHHGGCR